MSRSRAALLVTVLALSAGAWSGAILLGLSRPANPIGLTEILWGVGFLPLQVVGGIVLRRKPHNRVGQALLWAPLLIALSMVLFGWGEYGAASATDLLPGANWAMIIAGVLFSAGGCGLVLAMYRFPDGRGLGGPWRIGEWVTGAAVALLTAGAIMAPELDYETIVVPNPVAGPLPPWIGVIGELGGLAITAAALAAMASIVVRYRRGSHVTRLQLRWVLYPIGLGLGLLTLAGVLDATVFPELMQTNGPTEVAISIVFTVGVPAGIVMAITRAQLYEIDRLISRTVSYALLTSVLAGVYALGVLGIGALLPGERSDLLVAGSTLAVATLFRPLRSQIQALVDRRFHRARHDAAQIAERFSSRLRDEIDLSALRADLLQTARASVEPTAASLWLAP